MESAWTAYMRLLVKHFYTVLPAHTRLHRIATAANEDKSTVPHKFYSYWRDQASPCIQKNPWLEQKLCKTQEVMVQEWQVNDNLQLILLPYKVITMEEPSQLDEMLADLLIGIARIRIPNDEGALREVINAIRRLVLQDDDVLQTAHNPDIVMINFLCSCLRVDGFVRFVETGDNEVPTRAVYMKEDTHCYDEVALCARAQSKLSLVSNLTPFVCRRQNNLRLGMQVPPSLTPMVVPKSAALLMGGVGLKKPKKNRKEQNQRKKSVSP
jgi:hypothetical protein